MHTVTLILNLEHNPSSRHHDLETALIETLSDGLCLVIDEQTGTPRVGTGQLVDQSGNRVGDFKVEVAGTDHGGKNALLYTTRNHNPDGCC